MTALEARNPNIHPARWAQLAEDYPLDAYLNPARELFALEDPQYAWENLEQLHAVEWNKELLCLIIDASHEASIRALLYLGDHAVPSLESWLEAKRLISNTRLTPEQKSNTLEANARFVSNASNLALPESSFISNILRCVRDLTWSLHLGQAIRKCRHDDPFQRRLISEQVTIHAGARGYAKATLSQLRPTLSQRIALCHFLRQEALALYPEHRQQP